MHVSRTPLQENVKHLVTSVTCGENLPVSYAKLDRSGSWLKMCQGCEQVRLDDSMEEFSLKWTKWGIMSGGGVGEPLTLARPTKESECSSLATTPTITCRDYKGSSKQIFAKGRNPDTNSLCDAIERGQTTGLKLQPAFAEWMMGFPLNWTDMSAELKVPYRETIE